MTPIRPTAPSNVPAAPAAADPARQAQRAFFEAALGRTAPAQAPQAPVQAPAPQAPAAAAPSAQAAPAQPPAPGGRLLRPGSFIDIKV